MPKGVNYKLIDNLRVQEGWDHLINYFENELEGVITNAVATQDQDKALQYLSEYRSLQRVVLFLLRKRDMNILQFS